MQVQDERNVHVYAVDDDARGTQWYYPEEDAAEEWVTKIEGDGT